MIAGEVRPDAGTLAAFLGSVAITGGRLRQLTNQAQGAITRWPEFAAEAEVPSARVVEIGAMHRQLADRIGQIGRPTP